MSGPSPDVDRLLARGRADGTLARGAMSMHGFNIPVPGDGRYPCGRCIQCAKRNYATCTRPVASKSHRDHLLAPRPDPAAAAHDAEIAALLTKVRNSYADLVPV